MIQRVIILGGGSAGYLTAIAVKSRLPGLRVDVIRSKDIGVIGVGEGSTYGFTHFLHRYLRIPFKTFFEVARPTWKLGLKFIWGPRAEPFFYSFYNTQLNELLRGLSKSKGYYCDAEMECEHPATALMLHDRIFERQPDGRPAMHLTLSYHFENERFVQFLEAYATTMGVATIDDTVIHVHHDDSGVRGLVRKAGPAEQADLYVDYSGFVSALLGKALGEPFVSFKSTLACDRAVVGGWDRTSEPIKPYTTCETMASGWCWQIEHETRINRGYVYSSAFISDDEAEREFRAANSKIGPTRVVKFTSGRYERAWVNNVVAIGNAYGFVEPLEATALGVIGVQASLLADCLRDADAEPRPTQRTQFNRHVARFWDNIRAFLAVHYKFNTRLKSPFWDHCLNDTDMTGAEEVLEVYRENGPTPLWEPTLIDSANQFGLAGYFAMLVGQCVPYRKTHTPVEAEWNAWNSARRDYRTRAQAGFSVAESLAMIRSPQWQWPSP